MLRSKWTASPFTHCPYLHPQKLEQDLAHNRDVVDVYPSNGEMMLRPYWPENSPEETRLDTQVPPTAHGWYPTILEADFQASLFLQPEA